MLALAMCNITGSFFRSMPMCGAFTRSAIGQASGVRTTMSNIYASVLILLAALFLTPHFHLIPRCILSAVLISAVIFLVDYQIVKPLWKTNREYNNIIIGLGLGRQCTEKLEKLIALLQWKIGTQTLLLKYFVIDRF